MLDSGLWPGVLEQGGQLSGWALVLSPHLLGLWMPVPRLLLSFQTYVVLLEEKGTAAEEKVC